LDRVRIATSMSVTNRAAGRILSLPVFPELSAENSNFVARATAMVVSPDVLLEK
jgi:dTDP-4-amino-4,6-dideoxygalactose transaminase